MPLPSMLCIAFAIGLAAALAGRSELRISPRSAPMTRSFSALMIFMVLTLVPISVYFYIFHGDWFLLYLIDVNTLPSAIALVGFVLEAALGGLGFVVGAQMVRSQRDTVGGVLCGLALIVSVVVVVIAKDRLGVVGTYQQFHGGFGLTPFQNGPVMHGTALMSAILVCGVLYLLYRLHTSGRRG